MKKKFGLYIFLGLLIGGAFGSLLGAANSHYLAGLGLGALVGVFLGWFIAVAAFKNDGTKKKQ